MSGTVQTSFTCINLFHFYKNCMRYVPLLPPILHIKKLRHNFKRRIKIWGFKSEESSYRVYSYNHYITISKDIQILIKKENENLVLVHHVLPLNLCWPHKSPVCNHCQDEVFSPSLSLECLFLEYDRHAFHTWLVCVLFLYP